MLEQIKSLIIDLDGVVWLGRKPIKSAVRALKRIQRKGKKILYLTNNSTLSRADCAQRLKKMGLPAHLDYILTTAYGAARIISQDDSPAVYPIGERGLLRELREAGITILPIEKARQATHVVVGLDRRLNYKKLAAGMRAILSGAKFIATNLDCSYPTPEGLLPGAGAIVHALKAATGKEPDIVVGKPRPYLLELALDILGTSRKETALVGDRLDTDVPAGKRLGLKTILVLTGVTKEVSPSKSRPDLVVKSLGELDP